jgi:hypothetical protein
MARNNSGQFTSTKQPRRPKRMTANTPELDWQEGGRVGPGQTDSTAAELQRRLEQFADFPKPVTYAKPQPVVPLFPHHDNRNSIYTGGVRRVERQSAVLAATPPIKSGPDRNVGDELATLRARVAVLEAREAQVTPQPAPKAAPAPQQPQQSMEQFLEAQQARAYRQAVAEANRATTKPVGLR